MLTTSNFTQTLDISLTLPQETFYDYVTNLDLSALTINYSGFTLDSYMICGKNSIIQVPTVGLSLTSCSPYQNIFLETGNKITLPAPPTKLQTTTHMTLSFWFYIDNPNIVTTICSGSVISDPNGSFIVRISPYATATTFETSVWSNSFSLTNPLTRESQGTPTNYQNTWHHFTFSVITEIPTIWSSLDDHITNEQTPAATLAMMGLVNN
jgi:hypothetical protein